MFLDENIRQINEVFGYIPDFLYHGRIDNRESLQKNRFDIYIYNNYNLVKGKNFWDLNGRTNLDFAFHGFYLTPCEALARKWAYAKMTRENEYYQVLKYKVNRSFLNELNSKNLIVPDSEWAEFIYGNRAKLVNENNYDFVFGYIADGVMADIYPKIDSGHYTNRINQFHKDILKGPRRNALYMITIIIEILIV